MSRQTSRPHLSILIFAVAMSFMACGSNKGNTATDTGGPKCGYPSECIYNFACWNGNSSPNWSGRVDGSPNMQHKYNACARVDPTSDDWEAKAREKCALRCKNISFYGKYHCDPANWSEVEFEANYQTCGNEEELEELPCGLTDTCVALLDAPAQEALRNPATPATRFTAKTLVETNAASMRLLDGTPEPLAGEAAFTATECSASACPFYLAQLELRAPGTTTVNLATDQAPLHKTIEDLSIKLERPTLGLWRPASGEVVFPGGSLEFRAEATISGEPELAGENGHHERIYGLETVVRGGLIGEQLSLFASDEDALGPWEVRAAFAPRAATGGAR
jgi:hypothetical protein